MKNDQNVYNNGKDYCAGLTLQQKLDIKKNYKNINNSITLDITLMFVDFLVNKRFVKKLEGENIKNKIRRTKANANGYDIQYYDPNNEKSFIAEVKCNNPTTKDGIRYYFNGEQQNHIKNDIDHLKQDSNKYKKYEINENYYRFLVLMDVPGVKESMTSIINNFDDIFIYDERKDFKKDKINVVYINPYR